ncbi:MAG TPA: hypothetical protein PL082_01630 [Tepidiformaceae bacterium]|nr:hypothetical protein [Tepidiformaceae bacterium]
MHTIHHLKSAALAAFLSLSLAVAACGGDDSGDEPSGGTDETPTTAVSSGGELCRPTPYLISLRAAKGNTVAIDDVQFEVVSAKAVSLAGGAAYTIYLADYEIPDDQISSFSAPKPGADQTLVTVFITVFNGPANPPAIKAGEEIAFTPDFGVLTFRVVTQKGSETYSAYSTARGKVTLSDVGDSVCGEITYEDSATSGFSSIQNRLEGAFGAVVVKKY